MGQLLVYGFTYEGLPGERKAAILRGGTLIQLGVNEPAQKSSVWVVFGGVPRNSSSSRGHGHCQLEKFEGDFRRFASTIHQVACDV